MMFSDFTLYCNICGKIFKRSAGGGGWGRHVKCCKKECFNEYERRNTLSILGKPIEPKVIE